MKHIRALCQAVGDASLRETLAAACVSWQNAGTCNCFSACASFWRVFVVTEARRVLASPPCLVIGLQDSDCCRAR